MYAMFPFDNSVPLLDSPGGTQVATLTRAVVNSQVEIDAGGWVQVLETDGARVVELGRLDYVPPAGEIQEHFAAFAGLYAARDPNGFHTATIEVQNVGSAPTTVRLQLRQDDHWQEYVYDAAPGRATPREMYRVFGPAAALRQFGRVCLALALAVTVFAIARRSLTRAVA